MSDIATQTNIQEVFRQRLQETIQENFIKLIPEEMFKQMLDKATDEFIHGPRNKRYNTSNVWMSASDPRNPTGVDGHVSFETPIKDCTYNPHNDPSTLPGMIFLELQQLARKQVSELVATDPQFAVSEEKVNGSTYSSMVVNCMKDVVKDNAAVFMQSLIQRIIMQASFEIINNLRNQSGGGLRF